MEIDELILDRLRLRRAAISQIAGAEIHALDELVAEQGEKIRQRRDQRIAALQKRREELDAKPGT